MEALTGVYLNRSTRGETDDTWKSLSSSEVHKITKAIEAWQAAPEQQSTYMRLFEGIVWCELEISGKQSDELLESNQSIPS